MEISGINSTTPFMFPGNEKAGQTQSGHLQGDQVEVKAPTLLTDEEAEEVLAETINMIGQDKIAALSVHNLSEQRVFALLGI